jgi:hypothetical protein
MQAAAGIDHQPPEPKMPTQPAGCPVAKTPSKAS